MSQFSVVTAAVTEAATRLTQIDGAVEDLHLGLRHHAGAAEGTPGADVVDGLISHWASVLPEFAAAGSGLGALVAGAASAYGATEAALGAGFANPSGS